MDTMQKILIAVSVVMVIILIGVIIYMTKQSHAITPPVGQPITQQPPQVIPPIATSPIATPPIATPPIATQPIAPYKLPNGVTNGMIVRCMTTTAISKIDNNTIRWFSPIAYAKAGSPRYTHVDCNVLQSIPQGPPMPE